MRIACRKRWENDKVHWISVGLLAAVWASTLFFLIKPSGLRKADERLFAYSRAADASLLQFESGESLPRFLAKLVRIDAESLRKDGAKIFDAALKNDRLPQGALGHWALLFLVLEDETRARQALKEIDGSNDTLSQQKKLIEALMEGSPVSDATKEWVHNSYQAEVSELPEWYYLAYEEGDLGIQDWLEERGNAIVARGIFADGFALLVIAVSLFCLIWFVIVRKRLPCEIRHERFRQNWRTLHLLREFLIAEFLAYGAAWGISYLLSLLGLYQLSVICSGVVFMLMPVAWLVYRLTPGSQAAARILGLCDTAWKRGALIRFGIAGVGLLMSSALFLNFLDPSWIEMSDSISQEGLDSWIAVIWGFVLAGIFAPVCEEVIFRGFLFGGLRQRLGAVPAALVSSGIFGTLHFYSWVGLIVVIAYGLLFCWLYSRSNSLWPGIIAHSLFNFVLTSEMVGWLSFH